MGRWMFVCALILVLAACAEVPTPEPTAVSLLPAYTRTHTATPVALLTATPSATQTVLATPVAPTVTMTPEVVVAETSEIVTSTPLPTRTPTGTPTPTAIVVTTGPLLPAVATAEIWTDIGTPMVVAQVIIGPENVGQLTLLGRWGKGAISDAVYSADGREVAVRTALGVYFYDAATGEQIRFIPIAGSMIRIAVSPDWQIVAIASSVTEVELHRISDGTLLSTLTSPTHMGWLIGFSADGRTLLATDAAWHVDDGNLFSNDHDIQNWSADWQTVANFTDQGHLEISQLSVQEEQVIITPIDVIVPAENDRMTVAALSPDGQWVAMGGWDTNVELWRVADMTMVYDLETMEQNSNLEGKGILSSPARHSGPGDFYVRDIAFSPDGEKIAITTGLDETTIWDVNSGRLISRLRGVSGGVRFSPDSSVLATWDASLTQWQVSNGAGLHTLPQHMGSINDLAFTPDGSNLILASDLIYFRRVSDGALFTSLREGAGGVAITPDGQTVLSTNDRYLLIWNLADGTILHRLAAGSVWGISDLALSSNGQMAATVSHDDAVSVWGVRDGILLEEGYSMYGGEVAFTPDGLSLVTFVTAMDEIGLWPVPPMTAEGQSASLHPSVRFNSPTGVAPNMLAFSPDGGYLVASGGQYHIVMWDVVNQRLLYQLDGGEEWPVGIAFSPDGRLLASVSNEGKLRFWRMTDMALLHVVDISTRGVQTIAFSPDGRYLVGGTGSGLVLLWGVP
jgi:WD40 repeat protein